MIQDNDLNLQQSNQQNNSVNNSQQTTANFESTLNSNTTQKKPERKLDENGFVIEDPDDDAIVFDEDPFTFEVEEVKVPSSTNTNVSSNTQENSDTHTEIGTEQSGNITF